MAGKVKAVPEGFHSVTPHLVIRGAAAAIEFYKKAFGAVEIMRSPDPGGQLLMHATIRIGDAMVMLCDEYPTMERWVSPASLNGTTVALCIYTEDADAVFNKAVAAGCAVTMPIMDAFWGARYGKVTDPFGHEWEILTHTEDVSPEETARRAKVFFKSIQK